MFYDLFEHLRDNWRSTVKPALQNLLSEKRSLVTLFTVLLLSEMLLGILFLSYANNRTVEQTVRAECENALRNAEEDPYSGAETALAELSDQISKMAEMNKALFIFSAVIWFAVSAFVLSRVIASSVELKKMTYGLYIVFGADTKKIRRLIVWQMMTLGMIALLAAVPLSLLTVRLIYGFLPGGLVWVRDVVWISVTVTILLIAVIGGIALRTTSNTCVTLLTAADVSGYVKPPRRSSGRISADRPFGIAGIAVARMRSYYLPLVLSATLPACIFFSCLSLVRSNRLRGEGIVEEYTYVYSQGFSLSRLQNDFQPTLCSVGGIASVAASGSGYADDYGFHMLTQEKYISDPAKVQNCYDWYASDSVKLLSADPYSLWALRLSVEGGTDRSGVNAFKLQVPPEGTVTMLYPRTVWENWPEDYEPIFVPMEGSNLFFSAPQENCASLTLEEKLERSDRAGCTLKVNPSVTVRDAITHNKLTGKYTLHYQIIPEEYLLLNPADFKKVTGIDSADNAYRGLATDPVPLSEVGSYLAAELSEPPDDALLHTVQQEPLCAWNEFHALVADPNMLEAYGLPRDTILPTEPGTVTLVLSALSPLDPDIDRLLLSGCTEVEANTGSNDFYVRTNLDRLRLALKNTQVYTGYTVANVVQSDRVEGDILLMAEQDLAKLFGRADAYTDLHIHVRADLSAKELCNMIASLRRWEQFAEVNHRLPERRESGSLWKAFLMQSCRYNEVIFAISVLLLLSVPFIWFCPQYNHFKKRKQDLNTLRALGMKQSGIRKLILSEGAILSGISAAVALIFCPLFTLAVFLFIRFNGLPFAYHSFDFPALLIAMGVSAACAMATSLLGLSRKG